MPSTVAPAVLFWVTMTMGNAWAYPGPYPGSRILGGGGVCAVFSECPERVTEDFGITHYYVDDYTNDYVRAAYLKFRVGAEWEHALGTTMRKRLRKDLMLSAGPYYTTTEFQSLSDPEVRVTYRVFSTPSGTVVFDASVLNQGTKAKEVRIQSVVKFRMPAEFVHATPPDSPGMAVAAFKATRLGIAFVGGPATIAAPATPDAFPELCRDLEIPPGQSRNVRFAVIPRVQEGGVAPSFGELTWDACRDAWDRWLSSGARLVAADSALGSAYEAALIALAATSLNGAVPADMTGQFLTEGRPQLYPRDALMTARALAETGHSDLAARILEFWNAKIPQKSRGEWYARYDAFARATPGGSGAAFDVPEWDSNGYYASLMLLLFQKTGRWFGDFELMKQLLDFVVSKQGPDGLVREGGIVEWEGYLPATNMNVAAGLRHGALICEMRGDARPAVRYRRAAEAIERGLDRMFSRSRGSYMDLRDDREQFNTSANFGYVWGYPDHLELAATNAWYGRHTVQLGGGVQYFEAEGYGTDMFGFTTAAAAQYHFLAGEPDFGRRAVRWMMEHSNVYGMMPERIFFPDGKDVSPASPLSWCNAEFAVAAITAARVADPLTGGDTDYALGHLAVSLKEFHRILAAIPPRGSTFRDLLEAAEAGTSAIGAAGSVETRLREFRAALDRMAALMERGKRKEPCLADLALLAARLNDICNRVVANLSRAELLVLVPDPVAPLGRPVEMSVDLSAREHLVWTRLVIEGKDGNVKPFRQEMGGEEGRSAKALLRVSYDEGKPPYETSLRVSADANWMGIPFRMARTALIRIIDRFDIKTTESAGGVRWSVQSNLKTPGLHLAVGAPKGWKANPVTRAVGAKEQWEFDLVPSAAVQPGFHTFRLTVSGPMKESRTVRVPYQMTVDLRGSWEFRTGDDSSWADPAVAPGGWKPIDVPKTWEDGGFAGYDGFAWYRKEVDIPAAWQGRELELVLGAVDDQDWTFWNGQLIGHSTVWNAERRYRIPRGAVRAGRPNLIAIRVLDLVFGGGVWKPPVRIEMLP